jgi:ubiquinone/menaquinone biosynthesis C-methylase UbiE
MTTISHHSAKPSHYDQDAKHYDAFNEQNSAVINATIAKLLKQNKVKSALDLTCGTGSQVFWLNQQGFEVVGVDINAKMLKIAKQKARDQQLKVKFLKGDMRYSQVGQFDAALTIFNSIGHLTKADFELTMQNIHRNLKAGGLYIFDINNYSYLAEGNNITSLTIDWLRLDGDCKIREIQYSTLDEEGILASYTTAYVQKGKQKAKVTQSAQTLQIYTAQQLKEMLHKNGFTTVAQCDIDGSKFIENSSERILTIAKKR